MIQLLGRPIVAYFSDTDAEKHSNFHCLVNEKMVVKVNMALQGFKSS